jgi:1-acyl-sn-glycerol-3-phosphate acyltransferase
VFERLARGFGAVVGWGLFGGGCVLWAVTVVPVALLVSWLRPAAHERFVDLTCAALRLYIRVIPFMRVVVVGRERRSPSPRVVVANHQSFLDPIVMLSLEPGLSGPARRYLYRAPALGAILRLARFYEGEVGDPASLARMRAGGRDARDRGRSLLFFPEGTRSKDGEIGRFHRGAFRLAVEIGLPIQPVVIEGLDRVLPPHTLVPLKPWRYPVQVSYLPPVEPAAVGGPPRKASRVLAEEIRSAMNEEIARLRVTREE